MLTSSGVLCHLTKTPNTQKGLSDCGVLLQSPLVDKRGYKYINMSTSFQHRRFLYAIR